MKAYKGFNKDLTCAPGGKKFQYEVGKTYKENNANLCSTGFHACESPLDCFGYYVPASSVYHKVELSDVTDQREDDSKRVGKKIKIGAELSVAEICKIHFEYVNERCEAAKSNVAGDKKSATAGDSGAATAGDSGAATAGDSGAATAGHSGAATAGNRGAATAGEQGIACCRGGKVRGGLGCALCLTEVDEYGKNIKAVCKIVDGEKVKADTWYTLKKGRFVEVKDDE